MEYPIFNTKKLSGTTNRTYDLTDVAQRHMYFHDKAGKQIEAIKSYLENDVFLGFLLAKKQAGKGTFSKMLQEALGVDRLDHISVGDIVRDIDNASKNTEFKQELEKYMKMHYRGFISLTEAFDALYNRSQDKLLPTEFVLTLIKREIEKIGKKALFIDGMPRDLDQVSYSLFFRELINFSDTPDFFVLINTPEELINARMSGRRVCPECKTSKNLYFNPTGKIEYDKVSQEYVLICDNKLCSGYGKSRLITKEGDSEGISLIRARLDSDGQLLSKIDTLSGVSRIYLRNSVPTEKAAEYVEPYEIAFVYKYSGTENVTVSAEPLMFKDDSGAESYGLMAATVVVSLIHQIYDILGLADS